MRRIALTLAVALGALGDLGGSVAAARAPSSRPDRSLYETAKRSLTTLQGSPRLQARRSEWEKAVLRFRTVVARYPQSPYCDDALLAVGDLYGSMAKRFKTPRYNDDAVAAYRNLVAEYPSSSLGEQALFSVFEIVREGGDRKRLADAGRAYLDAFPEGGRAGEVKALVRKTAPVQAAALPSPPPPGLAQVFNLRFWSGESSTRVVIDLEKQVNVRYDRITHPDRLWVDMIGTRLHPNLSHRNFPVGDGLLEQIRLGQNKDNVVRVVLDFKNVKSHAVFFLQDPTRLVVDVSGATAPAVAQVEKPLEARPVPSETPAPVKIAEAAPPPSPTPAPAASAEARLPSRRVGPLAPPEAPPSPAPKASAFPEIEGPAPERRAASASPTPPAPPQINRAGSYSLARQLGLGARTIVVDAGHGGHDPGTIGRGGLQEKDLVLDVATRLEKLLRAELGAQVIMTRSSDVFIPLEERTAIANSKGADLFLSIHANSSRNPRARGIETYFLNFALDPHAEEVAARENAISAATLKDLQSLVKAIALNSKIDESRDFASSIQEALVENLRPHNGSVQNRGVHTAPFYVLIGANMPSILAEIAFLSHPEEERLLKSPEYRESIARSLVEGVRSYLQALSRTQTQQLTGTLQRSTVASKEGQR